MLQPETNPGLKLFFKDLLTMLDLRFLVNFVPRRCTKILCCLQSTITRKADDEVFPKTKANLKPNKTF